MAGLEKIWAWGLGECMNPSIDAMSHNVYFATLI
jgi:hypothetical protein